MPRKRIANTRFGCIVDLVANVPRGLTAKRRLAMKESLTASELAFFNRPGAES